MTQANAQASTLIDERATGATALIRDAMGPSMGYVAWQIATPCEGLSICTPSEDPTHDLPVSHLAEEEYPATREMAAISPPAASDDPRSASACVPTDQMKVPAATASQGERTKQQLRQVLRKRTDQLLDTRPKHRRSGGYGGSDQHDHHTTRNTRKGERQ